MDMWRGHNSKHKQAEVSLPREPHLDYRLLRVRREGYCCVRTLTEHQTMSIVLTQRPISTVWIKVARQQPLKLARRQHNSYTPEGSL